MELRLKRIVAAIMALLFSMSLSSCYDLGDFNDIEDYYDSFDDVEFFDKDLFKRSYSIKEYLYNVDTQNDFKKEDSGITFISTREYSYMQLSPTRDMTIKEIGFYICPESDSSITIEFYKVDSDVSGDFTSYDATERNDSDIKGSTIIETKSLSSGAWSYIKFDVDADFIGNSDKILFRFVNNTYDGKQAGLELVSFKLVNLLVYANFS